MHFPLHTVTPDDPRWPALLREIPDPPTKLYARGTVVPPSDRKFLAVVGSRKYSSYGRDVVETLIGALRGYPVTIVSGLALGIDALAHKAALAAGLHTVAVPGSGLDDTVLYPRSNRALAQQILDAGGRLLSEFEPDFAATPWSFPQRNRIMAGMSHATLVVEARQQSGTLITARLAADYNRDVLTVPGSIFSKHTEGPHMLIRLGATPIRYADDLLDALGFETAAAAPAAAGRTPEETKMLALLAEPLPRDVLIRLSGMDTSAGNVLLSRMELAGLVVEQSGFIRMV